MQRILILVFFLVGFSSNAQVNSQFFVDGVEGDRLHFQDSLQLIDHIRKIQIDWVNDGYLFAGTDSTLKVGDSLKIYLHKGEKHQFVNEKLRTKKLYKKLNGLLKDHVNNGYPFAQISLDSIGRNRSSLSGTIQVNTGPLIRYDTGFFFNEIKTSKSYIYQLLDIVPGQRFSERDYSRISKKISRSSFLDLARPVDLSFRNNKAKVFLDIVEEPANSFQGILGLQQVSEGNSIFVGNLELDIQNLFRTGKQFRFSWERFSSESQQLDILYKHPFFLDSRITPSFQLNILKQDTTFLNRSLLLGVHTFISPLTELFLHYEQTKGTLLSTDLKSISDAGLADYTRTVYGLSVGANDKKGIQKLMEKINWELGTSLGRKQIDKNLSLPDSYYDTIIHRTDFYQFTAHFEYQLRLLKRQAFYHQLDAGLLINDELLTNELFRIGGLQSLRGFNEMSIFSDQYLLSRSELRSFFEERSFIQVFYDQAVLRNRKSVDYLFGFGLGFTLATSAGQFSFAMAAGNNDSQISFSTVKVHFGYTSRF